MKELEDGNGFDKVWNIIKDKQTRRFISQFMKEMAPLLIEFSPEGDIQKSLAQNGIFKDPDIDHLQNKWSKRSPIFEMEVS